MLIHNFLLINKPPYLSLNLIKKTDFAIIEISFFHRNFFFTLTCHTSQSSKHQWYTNGHCSISKTNYSTFVKIINYNNKTRDLYVWVIHTSILLDTIQQLQYSTPLNQLHRLVKQWKRIFEAVVYRLTYRQCHKFPFRRRL